MSNWYMTDYFGEDKLLAPSIAISAIIVIVMLIIVVGGAF
jgi:ech hydrogenase subunit A